MQENASHTPEMVERFLDSTLESVDSAEELAVGMAQRAGMDEDDLMKVGMAIRESVVNAVVHGNRYNSHKKVRFAVTSDGQQFTVRIGDEGEGFDFDSIPDPWRRRTCCARRAGASSSSGLSWTISRCGTLSPGGPK